MAFVPEIHRSSVDLGNESQDCWGITLRVTESPDCFFCWMMLDGLMWPWNNSNQIGLFCSWTCFSFPMKGSTRSLDLASSLTVSWQDTTLLDSSLGVCVMLILNCRATNGVNLQLHCIAADLCCILMQCQECTSHSLWARMWRSTCQRLCGPFWWDAMPRCYAALFCWGLRSILMLAHLALFSLETVHLDHEAWNAWTIYGNLLGLYEGRGQMYLNLCMCCMCFFMPLL